MGNPKHRSRGFTLIASLMLLVLLSGVAVGLMYMVNGSGKVGGSDMEANVAYYGAESGMEKLTSDLANLYQLQLAPTQADLDALALSSPPNNAQIAGMTYLERATLTLPAGVPPPTSIIASGPSQGLIAEIIPVTLQVTAMRPSGASVNMTRGVQVALVPVFQFGVFSDSDLSYFAGPPFAFKGRVHTNGNLFLAADSGPLILDAKVTAVNQIIRDRLANNYNGAGYDGSVYVPDKNGGCDNLIAGGAQGPDCIDFGPDSNNATDDSSWGGGIPPNGAANGNWNNASTGTFNGMIGNAASIGVQPLQLPFVRGAIGGTADQQIQIIRRALPNEAATTPLGASREYNKANIRILLADKQADLRPGSPANADGQDIDLTVGCIPSVFAVSGAGNTATAWADNAAADNAWKLVNVGGGLAKPPATADDPCFGTAGEGGGAGTKWPLYSGWLRVEYKPVGNGPYVGVTSEWLQQGFARGILPPSVPVTTVSAGNNGVNPRAILILQQLADRNGDGALSGADAPSTVNTNYSWYPINFYDPREGFPRDVTLAGTQCYANGIMNAVELDVGNLRQWLLGNGPYAGLSGTLVDPSKENGYLVYFSDRRGMSKKTTVVPNVLTGESGLEDVINSGAGNGMPDGVKEAITPGYNNNNGFSPEDTDENGLLDRWGYPNMAEGFGKVTPAFNPYVSMDCLNYGRQNKVAGVRHVLRLVDGSWGNLPTKADGTGGFTVAAENPVYVLGDYNSNAADPFWGNPNAADIPHSAAAVIADAVTLLSNNWSDLNDMKNPNNLTNRNAADTHYRMAIASGKNMNFPQPAGTPKDFGTDGGVHNFLRYLEDWGGGPDSDYRGSLISLYYSEYATGLYKCCTTVYSPPNRNYFFDTQFLIPSNLPPGTPVLQDINNLTYWQSFSPCTNQAGGVCTN